MALQDDLTLDKVMVALSDHIGKEWRQLGILLEFTSPQLDRIENNNLRDTQGAIIEMLQAWWKRKDPQTCWIQEIKNALKDIGQNSVADHVEKEYGSMCKCNKHHPCEKGVRTNMPSTEHREQLVKEMKDCYKDSSKIRCRPWDEREILPIDDLFLDPLILRHDRSASQLERKVLESYEDIITMECSGKNPRKVVIQGDRGSGKTTLKQKMTYDWASEVQVPGNMKKFKLVISLNLNKVKDEESVYSLVENQLIPDLKNYISKEEFEDYLSENQEKILFILDGYDETRVLSKIITNIIGGECLKKAYVFLLSRPWKTHSHKLTNYAVVEIVGFGSWGQVEKYVSKFFTDKGMAKNFLTQATEKGIGDLLKNPLYLVLTCCIYLEENNILPNNVTDLFQNLLQFLSKCSMAKSQISEEEIDRILKSLGELSFKILLDDENGFMKESEKNDGDLQAALDLGLLSLEKVRTKSMKNLKINFPHKTFHEYYVALYLKDLEANHPDLQKFKTLIKASDQIFEFEMILQFCCGLSSERHGEFLQFIDSIYKNDSSITKMVDGLYENCYDKYTHALDNGLYILKKMKLCLELQMRCDYEGVPDKDMQLMYKTFYFVNERDMHMVKSSKHQNMNIKPYFSFVTGHSVSQMQLLCRYIDFSQIALIHVQGCEITPEVLEAIMGPRGEKAAPLCIIVDNICLHSAAFRGCSLQMLKHPGTRIIQLKKIKIKPQKYTNLEKKSDSQDFDTNSDLEVLAIVQCGDSVEQFWLPYACQMKNLQSLQTSLANISVFKSESSDGLRNLKTLKIDNSREKMTSEETEGSCGDHVVVPLTFIEDHPNLETVHFIACQITAPGSSCSTEQKKKESSLNEILFRECTIIDTEGQDTFKIFCQNKHLSLINFRESQISISALSSLGKVVANLPHLQRLCFLRNEGTFGNVKHLTKGLEESQINFELLKKLSLEDCIKSEEDMECVVFLLSLSPNIVYLSLNNVKKETRSGAETSCSAPLVYEDVLPKCLERLFIDGLKIGELTAPLVGKILKLKKLEKLSLSYNEIGKDAECLIQLFSLPCLKKLDIAENGISKSEKSKILNEAEKKKIDVTLKIHED